MFEKLKAFFEGTDNPQEAAKRVLQPDDIEDAVIKAIETTGRFVGGVADIPISYDIFVSKEDFDEYFGLRRTMLSEHISRMVSEYAQDVGGIMDASPYASFQIDGLLCKGECRVECSYRDTNREFGQTPILRPQASYFTPPIGAIENDAEDIKTLRPKSPSTTATPRRNNMASPVCEAPTPRMARIANGSETHAVSPGDSVGVMRDRSRLDLPDIEIDLEANNEAHQIHGRFGYNSELKTWMYTSLGSHGTKLYKKDCVRMAEEGRTEMLAEGDRLEFSEGTVYEFGSEQK